MFKKIIKSPLLACAIFFMSFYSADLPFKTQQLRSARVREAYKKKWPALQELLKSKHIDENNFDLYFRVFKQESLFEIYVKNTADKQYKLLKTIPICAKSGVLGPKRKQGDGQVPEGFYEINTFNPYSTYYLALQVNYPNKSDLIKSGGNPGGEIMIHGFCVTIGCIPLENEPVEEVYLLAVEAKNRDRSIRTDIYPFQMTEKNMEAMQKNYDAETGRFWNSLKKAYSYFELNHSLPKTTVDKAGNYLTENNQ